MSNPCLAELQITIFFAADSSAPSTHHLSGNVLLQPPVQLTVSPIPSTFLHKNKRKKTRSRRYATAPPSNISITLNSLAAFQHSHPPCQLVIFGQTHTRTHIFVQWGGAGQNLPKPHRALATWPCSPSEDGFPASFAGCTVLTRS